MEWIDIREQFPPDGEMILVFIVRLSSAFIEISAVSHDSKKFLNHKGLALQDIMHITHWMPLPDWPEFTKSKNYNDPTKTGKMI